jgi:rare lipoprotein A
VLCAALALIAALASTRPAAAVDLNELRQRAQAAADEVSALEHQLTSLESRKAKLDAEITEASQSLGAIDLDRQEAEARLETAAEHYESRAIEAYKNGPTSDLVLLLSADNLTDMYSVAQALGHEAKEDAQSLDALTAARDAAERAEARVDDRKQALLATKQEVDALGAEIGGTLAERRSVAHELGRQIAALEEQARAAAAAAAGTPSSPGAPAPSQDLANLLAPAGPSQGIPDGFAPTGITFEGTASWYGPGFEGQSTASGDIFDSRLYTAASKDLPLHSWLYVEHEGRGIVVLVNDRGPYVGDRILDLSQAAAQAIGISGLGWIQAEVLIKTD